ncbi:MAG TPA: hypothetical protein VFS46_02155 [Nitrososphaera sp.]|nr:hypothetical protein [Nitrososphaera sp.]
MGRADGARRRGQLSFTQRWLLMVAIATIILAVALLVLRINVRTVLVFYVIGLSVVTLWMIIDARYFSAPRKNIQATQPCACPICKHEYARMCLQDRCACCLITREEKVVGHSSSSLQ